MSDMSIDEAFKTLGISKNTTLREATKAYHKLSKKTHPDSNSSGSADRQARLNEAHEVVVAFLQTGSAGYLVPVEVKQTVQVLERGIARQEASRESETFVKQATARHTRPLQTFKYTAFLMAGFAAFVGWISNDMGVGRAFTPESLQIMKLMALALGAMGGVMQFIVQHQTHMIERFRDSMSDESGCVEFLHEVGVNPNESFTLPDLLQMASSDRPRSIFIPPGRLLLSLGKKERIELALLKGLEIGILERPAGSRRRYQVTAEFRPMFK